MIFSSKTLSQDRMSICEGCKHFRKGSRTCGTPIKGNNIKVNKKPYKLCGCFMDIKTTLRFARCPLDKWIDLQITHKEYLEVKDLLDNIESSNSISGVEQQQVKHYSKKYLGIEVSSSSCVPCVKRNIDRLKQIVTEYEK